MKEENDELVGSSYSVRESLKTILYIVNPNESKKPRKKSFYGSDAQKPKWHEMTYDELRQDIWDYACEIAELLGMDDLYEDLEKKSRKDKD